MMSSEPIFLVGIFLVALLAFANGSNDVSKGIATLVGSGITNYRRAILWGTLWTVVGAILAIFIAQEIVKTIATAIISNPSQMAGASALAPFSVILGASIWVGFATKTGLPVSTTHAIIGALCGVGLSAMGFNGVQWASLTQKALIPLAFSPLISVVLAFLFFPLVRSGLSQWRGHCLCLLPMERARLVLGQKGSVRVGSAGFQIIPVMDSPECNIPRGLSLRIGTDTLHWLTSGLTSFALDCRWGDPGDIHCSGNRKDDCNSDYFKPESDGRGIRACPLLCYFRGLDLGRVCDEDRSSGVDYPCYYRSPLRSGFKRHGL